MIYGEFKKICKREVNKTIAKKLGFDCDDNWRYNQNAMRDGVGSKYYANLTLAKPGDDKFLYIGWNPFESSSDAFGLLVSFDMSVSVNGLDEIEFRNSVIYMAYLKSIDQEQNQ